jgi:hypothetical protein
MAAFFEANRVGDPDIMLDMTVDRDGDTFLSVTATTRDDSQEVFDYFTASPEEIEEFFRVVDTAKRDWERLKAED